MIIDNDKQPQGGPQEAAGSRRRPQAVLVACEVTQSVTAAFRRRGIAAWSCDILPTMGRKEWHIEGDACEAMQSTAWDMIIAFPPCTHLAASGARHFAAKRADGRQAAAIDFFMAFVEAKASYKAIENPIGIMSSEYRKPDQIIHPWMFGYPTTKATCLWLYNLPLLVPTNVVNKGEVVTLSSGKRMSKWYYDISTRPVGERAAARSATFPGVAEAMAEQWGAARRAGAVSERSGEFA